jgi:hypothetical protein
MAGMEINLGFTGLDAAVRRMRELEQAAGGVARNVNAAGGGGAGAGPAARAAAAERGFMRAYAGNDPAAMFDAEVRVLRSRQSLERAQRLLNPERSSIGQRLAQAISTSRFGAGGVMPLVGRTAAIIGGEAAAGPIGLAVAGATLAINTFSSVIHDATQTVGEFRRAATVTGGTAAQTASIAAMGVAPGQQGAVAAGLRQQLSTNPMAIMLAQRIGLGFQLPRPFGTANEAQLLQTFQKGIRGLVDLGKAEEALRIAREFGLESLIDEAKVTRRIRDQRDTEAQVTGRLIEENAQRFRDFDAQSSRFGEALDRLKIQIGGELVPAAGEAKGALATFLDWLRRFREWQTDPEEIFTGQTGRGAPAQTPEGRAAAAQKANTDAVNENTTALKNVSTGPRASGTFPAELRGRGVAELLEKDRVKLGVFGN